MFASHQCYFYLQQATAMLQHIMLHICWISQYALNQGPVCELVGLKQLQRTVEVMPKSTGKNDTRFVSVTSCYAIIQHSCVPGLADSLNQPVPSENYMASGQEGIATPLTTLTCGTCQSYLWQREIKTEGSPKQTTLSSHT